MTNLRDDLYPRHFSGDLGKALDPDREYAAKQQAYANDTPGGRYHSFGEVVLALHQGFEAWREGWNDVGLRIKMQFPNSQSDMTQPYMYLSYTGGVLDKSPAKVPWMTSQVDLLASDWRIQKTIVTDHL